MMTIASDEEVELEEETDSDGDLDERSTSAVGAKPVLTKAGKKRQRQKAAKAGSKEEQGPVDPSFSFDVESSLGIAERQAMRGWDFKSKTFMTTDCLFDWRASTSSVAAEVRSVQCLEVMSL